MDKIKRFFECYVPVSVCNLKCSYCYVMQENRRKMKIEPFAHSPQYIANALRKERVGGTCLFNLCGIGETTAHPDTIELVKCLLQQGHYVSITTNGTLSHKFDSLIDNCKDYLNYLHVAFSLHYIELLNKGWLDRFFDNVIKMRNSGASILVQINMCDEYMPYIAEIKKICHERVGAYPQVALTRNENTNPISILTSGSVENYIACGKEFNSPLFDFTVQNFMQKRTEFCYAGDWTGILNLQTGTFKKCYNHHDEINILEDPNSNIPFQAIGTHCTNQYCINSSHFMSLGVIPEIVTPTYAQLRNRNEASWYSAEINTFLNSKLVESNKPYSLISKFKTNNPNQKVSLRGVLSEFRFYQKLHQIKTSYMSRRK